MAATSTLFYIVNWKEEYTSQTQIFTSLHVMICSSAIRWDHSGRCPQQLDCILSSGFLSVEGAADVTGGGGARRRQLCTSVSPHRLIAGPVTAGWWKCLWRWASPWDSLDLSIKKEEWQNSNSLSSFRFKKIGRNLVKLLFCLFVYYPITENVFLKHSL